MSLSKLAVSVKRDRLTYLNSEKLERLENLAASADEKAVPGDFLEFGVALGGSAIVLASHALARQRAFHGFDVFGMIPPPTSEMDDAKSRARYATIASGGAEGIGGQQYYGYRNDLYGDVVAAFRRYGLEVDGTMVALHKGLFQDTLETYTGQCAALVHLDCDWYDPVLYCLERVDPLLSLGGVIVVDDYYAYGGCRAAVDEFRHSHPNYDFVGAGPNPFLRRIT